MSKKILFCFLAVFWLPTLAADPAAQPAANATKVDKSDFGKTLADYSVDLSIPDTTGISIVGLSAEKILRPTTPRALGLAVLQGRTEDGSAKEGFAIDFAPTKLIDPTMNKETYRSNKGWLVRPLWNTQISAGIGQPLSDKDNSTRIGIGINSVLWRSEASDPLLNKDHAACMDKELQNALPTDFPGLDGDAVNLNKEFAEIKKPLALKACRTKLENETWNASALMVGIARATVSGRDSAVIPDVHPTGYWVSYNYGFENVPSLRSILQLTASFRKIDDEIIADPNDKEKFVSQDTQLIGMKLYGRASIANLFIEVSRNRTTIVGRETENSNLFVVGAERKISDNLWLTLAMGTKRGGTDTSPTYVSTGLKFGYEKAASIK